MRRICSGYGILSCMRSYLIRADALRLINCLPEKMIWDVWKLAFCDHLLKDWKFIGDVFIVFLSDYISDNSCLFGFDDLDPLTMTLKESECLLITVFLQIIYHEIVTFWNI